MRKVAIILSVLMLFSFTLHSQTRVFETDKIGIISFLKKYCSYGELNPTHQEETDRVNHFVQKIFDKQYISDDIPDLITQSLQLFYDNSISELDDSPDFTRMITRRSMCLIALAFLSGELNLPNFWFLTDARQNLNRLASDLNGSMMLIVNIVELYTDLSWKYASKKGIEYKVSQYKDDLKIRENDISDKNFIAEYEEILLGVTISIRELEK
jgi:hypothetical protein